MGSMNRRGGLLAMAIALVTGMGGAIDKSLEGMNQTQQNVLGQRLRYSLDNHYRTIRTSARGAAARSKRASIKRRNIAKRNRSASQ